MAKRSFYQKFFSICGKVAGGAAALGGAYEFIKQLISPTETFLEIITSPTAYVIYALLAIVAVCAYLNERYKSLSEKNEELSEKIRLLNLELNEASTKLESAMRNGQIATFKNRFFLTTEKLYIDLADKIQNNISITRMSIHNTIDDVGVGGKRDSHICLYIEGVALAKTSQIQILAAGDTIVSWSDIKFEAYEIVHGNRVQLIAALADNGQDSHLKQVVVSYKDDKKEGDCINLIIEWVWPNMLSIKSEDYTTLPIVLSTVTKKIEMSIEPRVPINFKDVAVYRYNEGMPTADLIKRLEPDPVNNRIYYSVEDPDYKSCYILYYNIDNN